MDFIKSILAAVSVACVTFGVIQFCQWVFE